MINTPVPYVKRRRAAIISCLYWGALVFLLLLSIAGCARDPASYPPPPQSAPLPPLEAGALLGFIEMNAVDAPSYIVRDIAPAVEGALWRWAWRRPAIRVSVPGGDGLRFVMNFAVPEALLSKTGPIVITFAVNGRILDKVRYATPGTKTFEKPVPSTLLRAGEIAILTAEPDKTLRYGEGVDLGFIMIGAGFKP